MNQEITVEQLLDAENRYTLVNRVSSLWNIMWINVLPVLVVFPGAFERIPESYATKGIIAGSMQSAFAVFLFIVSTYISLIVQQLFVSPFNALVNWLVGVPKTD
ncbi:MAG: hypothetical protein COA78_05690 [Blastopirellula sp.]|nr:MAG: hypothetical protein COA78_05690 [Blastopirellula sp.]